MAKTYEPRQMSIVDFIQQKLVINDVEPSYQAIHLAGLTLLARRKLCFAEVFTDHLGFACDIAEAKDFWGACESFIEQPIRGPARRYFRGPKAVRALHDIRGSTSISHSGDISDLFNFMPKTYAKAKSYVCLLPEFGPGSAFKLADMSERVGGVPIDFRDATIKDLGALPLKGLSLAVDYENQRDNRMPQPGDQHNLFWKLLRYKHWKRKAPPRRDRELNVQELETCLCNYGHSKWRLPGRETEAVMSELEGHGRLAMKLRAILKQLPEMKL